MIADYNFDPITKHQKRAIESISPHLLFCGQGGCGKTFTGANKALFIGGKYSQGCIALVRKKRVDLKATLWKVFDEQILPYDFIIEKNDADLYRKIRNGTEFYGIGLDSTGDVNKLASREYNFVVIEEATELTEKDYDEKIIRTVRLPSSPFHQIFSLCNPQSPNHWIYKRFYLSHDPDYEHIDGKTLPPPWLPEQYYKFLAKLTGIFAKRYRDGEWIGAEGVVYPFDPNRHIIDPIYLPKEWVRVVGIDFGFSLMHACCVLWFAVSPKGKWYCYRQIYTTGKTVAELSPIIKKYMIEDNILKTPIVCDHDADGRATLELNEMETIPAIKDRIYGQQLAHDKIANDEIYFFSNCLVEEDVDLKMHKLPCRTEDEFAYYVWANKEKEDMVRKLDHGMDVIRYLIATLINRLGETYDTKIYAPKILTR